MVLGLFRVISIWRRVRAEKTLRPEGKKKLYYTVRVWVGLCPPPSLKRYVEVCDELNRTPKCTC